MESSAGSKSFVSWHQDNTYWGLSSRNVVTAWFAISEVSVDAGCMKVMPGTHQGDTLAHEDIYDADNMLTLGYLCAGYLPRAQPVILRPFLSSKADNEQDRIRHALARRIRSCSLCC